MQTDATVNTKSHLQVITAPETKTVTPEFLSTKLNEKYNRIDEMLVASQVTWAKMRLRRPCSWETFFMTSNLVSITCCSGPRIDSRSGNWQTQTGMLRHQ